MRTEIERAVVLLQRGDDESLEQALTLPQIWSEVQSDK
jgi:hypothetical protein